MRGIDPRRVCPLKRSVIWELFNRFQVLFRVASSASFQSFALTGPLSQGCLVVPSEDYSHGQTLLRGLRQ